MSLLKTNPTKNRKNPRTVWELHIKVAIDSKSTNKFYKIAFQGHCIDDSKLMPQHFNDFFANIGKEISESVPNGKISSIIHY